MNMIKQFYDRSESESAVILSLAHDDDHQDYCLSRNVNWKWLTVITAIDRLTDNSTDGSAIVFMPLDSVIGSRKVTHRKRAWASDDRGKMSIGER
jgi:hypothetical protein